MGLVTRTGECKFCHQHKQVRVRDDREYSEDELNTLATEECDCQGAELARKKNKDVGRCENFIAAVVSKRFPGMTSLLHFDVQTVADQQSDKITRKKDGYTFTTGPTKDRFVDIKIKWSMESEPDAPTPLTAPKEDIPEAREAEELVPEEIE